MFKLELQLFDTFDIVGVGNDAVDGADGDAGRFVVVSDTFGASVRIDDVDGISLFDGAVGAFIATCVTCYTFIGNHQCHIITFLKGCR
jgi:hypothetical protein